MRIKQVLESWTTLNESIVSCTEKQALELMNAELDGACRKNFVTRCYSRYNRMRAARERKEIDAKVQASHR